MNFRTSYAYIHCLLFVVLAKRASSFGEISHLEKSSSSTRLIGRPFFIENEMVQDEKHTIRMNKIEIEGITSKKKSLYATK